MTLEREAAVAWLHARRPSGLAPSEAMEIWFGDLATQCEEIRQLLARVGQDGSLRLKPEDTAWRFLRFDLSSSLVRLLGGRKYGWTDALDEFSDTVWRADSTPQVPIPREIPDLGHASLALAETIELLVIALEEMREAHHVGDLLRRGFVQTCQLLIVVEAELAQLAQG